jgi:transcriptional regulator
MGISSPTARRTSHSQLNARQAHQGGSGFAMYIPEAFRVADRDVIERFLATYGFAALVTQTNEGPFATHVPLLIDREDDRDVLLGHVARANSQWRSFDGKTRALAIFQGPHAYVSPTWYATSPAVPTWNYATIHAYGCPRVIDDRMRVRRILDRLVAKYESSRSAPWQMSTLSPEYESRMMSAIVGFEMPIDRLEAKFKLGQNRSLEDIRGVIAGLVDRGGPDDDAIADLTRDVLEAKDS